MFNLFKAEDTPLDKLATVESKIAELAVNKSDLQEKIDDLELRLTRSLVSEALADKAAAAQSDKLTVELEKARRELKATELAHDELTDQLDNLKRAAEAYEDQEYERKLMDDAKAKRKALPAAVKKAQKSAEAYKAAQIEVAAVSRQAATAIEEETNEALRAEYQTWRGFVNFSNLSEFHYLTGLEAADLYLEQIIEYGSRAIEAENPRKITAEEKAEAQRKATTAHIMAQGQANREFNKLYSKDAA